MIPVPLCDRLIPEQAKRSRHHLVPVLKGGKNKNTVRLHQISHDTIHAHYSESEIAKRLADIESLKADSIISDFIKWVQTKPNDFSTPRPNFQTNEKIKNVLVRNDLEPISLHAVSF